MLLLRLALIAFLAVPAAVSAQSTDVAFGGISADLDAPVEVTSDSLAVDQETGTAVFSGNVVIGQGELRISAGEVRIVYGEDAGTIVRLVASGGVTFVTATEAAEAQDADYDLTTGQLIMSGEVLLTQGATAIAAERMVIDLVSGSARMEGRVRTILQQSAN